MKYNFDFEKISIGVDIVETERFSNLSKKERFLKNVFTEKEMRDCREKSNMAESLSARFAAKEAVKKTIKENISFNQIEISNDDAGAPKVNFLDKKINKKYKSLVSISHIKTIAEAICITCKKYG